MKTAAPRNVAQATALLTRWAELDGQIAALEARRQRMIARTNAAIDAKLPELLAERTAIADKAKPWWAKAGPGLVKKDQKSIELGGCMIGTVASRDVVGHDFDSDEKAAIALRATRFGKPLTRVSFGLERAAALKLLQTKGAIATALAKLGFRIVPGEDTFFLKRAKQRGTAGA